MSRREQKSLPFASISNMAGPTKAHLVQDLQTAQELIASLQSEIQQQKAKSSEKEKIVEEEHRKVCEKLQETTQELSQKEE